METRKVLSGLCYFSVFFAGFLFPLVVMLASGDDMTKRHAKSALLSHLIPLIPLPVMIIALINEISNNPDQVPVFTIGTAIVMVIISIIVVIWNVIKGVKVFVQE
nr:DUF4870 domain-containing protein [Neobacillus sp. Marseille-Q6967]